MRAEIRVSHKMTDDDHVHRALVGKFGHDDREVLKRSPIFKSRKWERVVSFAHEHPDYRIICYQSSNDELQINVEAINGNILSAAESVWRSVKRAFDGSSPVLSDARLLDGDSNRELLHGRTGLVSEFKRRDTLLPVSGAFFALVYFVVSLSVFEQPFGAVGGALVGAAVGLVAMLLAVTDARRGAIRWN
ncbi:hypothetical protein [Amycolatopsis xylanica]|uniref:hypothetical protein n=1 Tax=Amycolatopsis xylanica TaxID=589385 RepID=UPI00115F8D21|nr:hypothetical protein [Amycolatopsis xylanica]